MDVYSTDLKQKLSRKPDTVRTKTLVAAVAGAPSKGSCRRRAVTENIRNRDGERM